MSSRAVALGVVLLVVTGGIVGVFALGINPVDTVTSVASDGSTGDDTGTGGATGESTDGDAANGGGSSGGDATNSTQAGSGDTPDFTFVVKDISECGTTCRDVTVAATNTMDSPATDVTVKTRISADGDKLWTGTESFSEVAAGETKTRTKRVKLSYFEAAKVKNNDGYITVTTTITWDGGEQTFSERRKVA